MFEQPDLPIYIAIKGVVFDVTDGKGLVFAFYFLP